MNKFKLLLASVSILIWSCGGEKPEGEQKNDELIQQNKYVMKSPAFNADSAFSFIEKQLSFGPRVPGTEGSRKCAIWLEKKLKEYGLDVSVQRGEMTAYNGKQLPVINIHGKSKSTSANRILLFAHWDTRPYADSDTVDQNKPIPGANDGASGVAVLLEIARSLSQQPKPEVAIDFLFVDAEDYGQPQETMMAPKENTWCLGTQYWASKKPADYNPKYGILLDMVGARDAIFPIEAKSASFAPDVVNNVWNTADKLGYGNYFVKQTVDFVGSDDHVYMTKLANIPSIDIIQFDPRSGGFGEYHHTHQDNIKIIEKTTLKAVGQTVMEVLYKEGAVQ